MSALGMLADGDPEPSPPFPEWDRSVYASYREHRLANPAVWAAYKAAERRRLSQTGDGPEMARFKLSSNDGWIVTGEEVAASLARYGALPQDRRTQLEQDDPWRQWIAWLRRASAGFEVH